MPLQLRLDAPEDELKCAASAEVDRVPEPLAKVEPANSAADLTRHTLHVHAGRAAVAKVGGGQVVVRAEVLHLRGR